MRLTILFICISICRMGFTQLTMKAISKHDQQRVKSYGKGDIAQATLPFWDDFSITMQSPDSIRIWGTDTTRQWNYEASKNVHINETLAKNPPTYRVATFDGLDVNGNFHGTGTDLTDELVSDTINLSKFRESDDLYFSFYWQGGGNVEMPDEGDSLVLHFHNPVAAINGGNPWETVWAKDGVDIPNDSIFYQKAIKVEQRFLTDQFIFRFQAFGDQNGPFDAWHLDYIYMNVNRSGDNFFYLDRGFTGQLTSPFSPFKALPVNQFMANQAELTSPQSVRAFNLDKFIQPTEYIVVIKELVNDLRIDSIQFGKKDPLLPNSNSLILSQKRILHFDGIDLTSIPNQDSIVLQSVLYIESSDDDFLDGTQINLRINDTLKAEYLLNDFYAYDDGTAEYAVGTNIKGGQVGVQFWVEEEDTLTHIDIYFPNIAPSSDGANITLRIYQDLQDEFPIRSQPITIMNAPDLNIFTSYALDRPVIVSDTFYITYEQNIDEYIGIGFDRSNPEASRYLFENIKDEWVRSRQLGGALMIRPVFKKVTDFVLGNERTEKFEVYPNPTSKFLSIKDSYKFIQIHNLSGRLILSEEIAPTHDISNLQSGLYLLTIQHKNGIQIQKIIKE